MQIHGFGQTASQSAKELYVLWKHLGDYECVEQIEAHMESEGFSLNEIEAELVALGLDFERLYELRVVGPI